MSFESFELLRYFEFARKYPFLFDNENSLFRIEMNKETIRSWQQNFEKEGREPNFETKIGVIYEDKYITLVKDLVHFESGRTAGYFRIIHRSEIENGVATAVLPVCDGRILLLNQYRHATRKYELEIPRGHGECCENAENNMRREFHEETGGQIKNFVDLGFIYPDTGVESQKVNLFFAEVDSFSTPNKEEGIISFTLLLPHEVEEYIMNRKICDGFTICCFLKAKLFNLV